MNSTAFLAADSELYGGEGNDELLADGTVLSISELLARGFDLDGTNLDDAFTSTTDRINGLCGNDSLYGGAGSERMRWQTHTIFLNSKAANDEITQAWRIAA